MIGFYLKIINLHFLISIIGTQTKVKIRLYSATDYLEYRQKIENIFLLREPSLCYPFTRFFSKQKRKGNSLEKFLFRKMTKVKWVFQNGKPRRKCSVYLERIKKGANVF